MSNPVPSPRRLALAVGTAAAATTLAIGVTAASLLGWFRPADGNPEVPPVPVVEPVPVLEPAPADPAPAPEAAPVLDPSAEVQLAMYDDDEHDDEHDDDDDDDDEEDHDDDD